MPDACTRAVTSLDYDSLVLAPGAVTATFGVPGVDEHAFGLKSLADVSRAPRPRARAVRARPTPTLERRSTTARLTVVIAGGGPTGVELAGGLAELFWRVLDRDFPQLDVRGPESCSSRRPTELLGGFAPSLGKRARRALERRGVEVLTGVTVDGGHRRVGASSATAPRSPPAR